MEIQKSIGVVLSSTQSGEADCFTRMYTKEFGKRNFLLKGIKKSKRRSSVISEPGTIANLVYYFHEDKNLYIVNEFRVHMHYLSIRDDLISILLLYFLLEIVEKTTAFNDTNKSIFDLLTTAIGIISKTDYKEHLAVSFIFYLLKLHGILPDFTVCKRCGQPAAGKLIIDTLDFHPLCSNCENTSKQNTVTFTNNTWEFILHSMQIKFLAIDHSSFPSDDIKNLLFHLTLFIENYFHINIKSKNLLLSELS